MQLSALDYDLPAELIAQTPLPERSGSRLLVVDGAELSDRHFGEIPALLEPSLLVFNDTKVFAARLIGRKPTGGKAEVLLVRKLGGDATRQRWLALGRASKGMKKGQVVTVADGAIEVTVVDKRADAQLEVELRSRADLDAQIDAVGQVPLPPYIGRPPRPEDRTRYQTVYARHRGAVAAPTAGLHFSEALLAQLAGEGHQLAYVTLHVGPGTFAPIKANDLSHHQMHEEHFKVPEDTARGIVEAQSEGRRVVAVGTTVVRALESAGREGAVSSGKGATRLFITPGFEFKVVDDLITNFHLPRSTLLALVMAFGGVAPLTAAYAHAVAERYRFFSYGDAMLIRGRCA